MDVLCGGCGRTLTLDDDEAVHDVPCPHCGRLIRVSALEDEAPVGDDDRLLAPLQASEDLSDDFLTKAKLALRKKMLVVCGSCDERLTVHQRLAGTTARCPSCGQQIFVPSMNEDGENMQRRETPHDLGVEAGDMESDVAAAASVEESVEAPRPRRRRIPTRRKKSNRTAVLLLMFLGTAICGGVLGYLAFRDRGEDPIETGQRPVDVPDKPAKDDPWSMMPTTPKPPELGPLAPWPGGVKPAPTDPTPREGLKASMKVVTATVDFLVGESLIPAPSGKAFLLATVRIRAGAEAVRFNTADGTVSLVSEGVEMPVLGVPAPTGSFAVGARQATLDIPATTSQLETFVFVVPAGLSGGVIYVTDVAVADLPKLPKPRKLGRRRMRGTYAEVARFLKLGFGDPVMERVRRAGKHEIVITGRRGKFTVAIPKTSLTGSAKPDGPGSLTAELTDGSARLSSRLRFHGDGKHLVLYLADAPYHQIVYKKQ